MTLSNGLEDVFAQGPLSAPTAATQQQELRRRLNSLLIAQESAESSWRGHQQLLVDRAASHGERFAAQTGEVLASRALRLADAQRAAANARLALARAQVFMGAVPGSPAAVAFANGEARSLEQVNQLLTQAQSWITTQNRNFTDYESSFHGLSAATAMVTTGIIDGLHEAYRRTRNMINAPPYVPAVQRYRLGEQATAPRRTPAANIDATDHPLYTNRQEMLPDPEANIIRAANDDWQRWLARREELLLRGRRGSQSLPTLLVPRFNHYLIESEFIRTRGSTAATRNEALRVLDHRMNYYQIIANETADPLLKLRRISAAVVQDFLRNYHRDSRSLVDALQGRGNNCEGRARLLYGVISALGLEMPSGYQLGVQLFTDHTELVIHNPQAHPPVIQLFGQNGSELIGPVYHAAVLLQDFIGSRSPGASPIVASPDLLLAAANPSLANGHDPSSTIRIADGLGTRLPLPPGNYFATAPIPEFGVNEAPNPSQPIVVRTSPRDIISQQGNGNGVNGVRTLMQNTFGREASTPTRPARLFLDPVNDAASFCTALVDELRSARSRSQHNIVLANYRNQLLYRIPGLIELGWHPEQLLNFPDVMSFLRQTKEVTYEEFFYGTESGVSPGIVTREKTCPEIIFGGSAGVMSALRQEMIRQMTTRHWHEAALMSDALGIPENSAECALLRLVRYQDYEVRFGPHVILRQPVISNPMTTQDPSATRTRHIYVPVEEVVGHGASDQPTPSQTESSPPNQLTQVSEADVRTLFNSRCLSSYSDRRENGFSRAYLRSLCRASQQVMAQYRDSNPWNVAFILFDGFEKLNTLQLRRLLNADLQGCTTASLTSLAAHLNRLNEDYGRPSGHNIFCQGHADQSERRTAIDAVNRIYRMLREHVPEARGRLENFDPRCSDANQQGGTVNQPLRGGISKPGTSADDPE